jgi:AcrR family transcriptional regulator
VAVRRKRRYVKAARATAELATRERILQAVIALHEEVGPGRTTVKGIAGKAGVQRLTVYRHFPDERSLLTACSARWLEENPLPEPSAVPAGGSQRRARELLLALYRYYRRTDRMLANIVADAAHMPAVEAELAPLLAYVDSIAVAIDRSWPRRSSRRRATLRHAVEFGTWRSLTTLTGSDSEAADLVMRWCEPL